MTKKHHQEKIKAVIKLFPLEREKCLRKNSSKINVFNDGYNLARKEIIEIIKSREFLIKFFTGL